MKTQQTLSRRSFIQNTATASVVFTIPTIIPAYAFGAHDRIRAAVLGVNGRGTNHVEGMQHLDNVEVACLCDPDSEVLAKRAGEFQEKYGLKVKTEKDLRRVFDDKEIDVVTIAMPNHWHSPATIWAWQAGKYVYVEKPGSYNIFGGRKMVEAARKYNRIVQHGVQLRNSTAIQEAIQHLREGLIGKVYMARGLVFRWRPDIGDLGTEPVPANVDYDMWTGPAQMRPFSRDLVHYNWHWDYGNGDVGNQGIHETDLCMWGINVGLPAKITSMGGKFLWDDCKETPEVQSSIYYYPKDKKIIQFEVRHWMTNAEDGASVGNIFYGDKGYLVIKGYDTYETYLGQKKEPGPAGKARGDHYLNFVQAVRSRDESKLNGPVEIAHLSSALAHLGNIAYKTGRVLTFDPVIETFPGDAEANAMLSRKYRAPFDVPDKV